MQETQRCRARATRRRFLGSLGVAAVGLGAASQSGAATDSASSSKSEFVVEQGDRCIPVVALSGDVPIEERYGWAVEGSDFSATGFVDLQRPDTSVLFLYDGPNGLSLVVVHDEYGDGTDGGSVTFEFAGLPPDGEWAVQDDYYDDGSNFDQWTRDGDEATVDWTWGESRTDGGAFRGLDTDPDLELRIDPSFNAEATLYGKYYDGKITDWEVLSESADGRTRTSLALDEPIVVRRGTCSTDGTSDNEDSKDSDDKDDHDDTKDDHDDSKDDHDDSKDDHDDSKDDDKDDHDGSEDDGKDDHDTKDDEKEDPEDGEKDDSKDEDKDDYDDSEDDEDDEDDKDDDKDDEDDEDDEDDHPGKGKGHERGRGKGHERGRGKGHERHGDDHDDESEGKRDAQGTGKGKGANRGKGKGNGKGRGK